MLAQQLFFIISLSILVNSSSLFCMEKKEMTPIHRLPKLCETQSKNKETDDEREHNKAIRYVAAVEQARRKARPSPVEYTSIRDVNNRGILSPLPKSVPLLELPDIKYEDFNTMHELSSQIANLKSLMKKNESRQTKEQKKQYQALLTSLRHNKRIIESQWEKEIFPELSKKAQYQTVTINFENNTTSALRIDRKTLNPKECAQIEFSLVPCTNRLSICEIPIYGTIEVQLLGKTLYHEKNKNKVIAVIRGIRDQIIDGQPVYCFHTESFIGGKLQDDTNNDETDTSKEIEGNENTSYFGSVILESDQTDNLKMRVGIDNSLYEAVKNIHKKQQELAHAEVLKATKDTPTKSLPSTLPTITSPEEQSTIMPDEESSIKTVKADKATTAENNPRINKSKFANAQVDAMPRGGIGVSQSTTSVIKEPARPAAKKTEEESRTGSLIYGSLRRALARTVSLTDVNKGVKKEHRQPQEMKGNA